METLLSFSHLLALAVLAVVLLGGLMLVPLGLPGLWLMLAAGVLYWLLVPAAGIGPGVLVLALLLAAIAEYLEFTISGRYAERFGGSRRAAWGAIGGGLVGALLGVPVPVVGSLIGAMLGAFLGAFAGELTVHRDSRAHPGRVATGALLGRAVAGAAKSAMAVLVAIVLMAAAVGGAMG